MSETSIPYGTGLAEDLRDPNEAIAYLNAALEDGSREIFLMALRDVAAAWSTAAVSRGFLFGFQSEGRPR